MSQRALYIFSAVFLVGGVSVFALDHAAAAKDRLPALSVLEGQNLPSSAGHILLSQNYQNYSAGSYDPAMQGGPLAAPMPAQVQQDLSGGPLASAPPAGTAPAAGGAYLGGYSTENSAGPTYSGGTYQTPASQLSNSGLATYSTGSGQPAPSVVPGSLAGGMPAYSAPQGETYLGETYSGGTYQNHGQFANAPTHSQPAYQASPYDFQTGSSTSYPQTAPYQTAQYGAAQQNQSFWNKIGLGNLKVFTEGFARIGGAAVKRDNKNGAAISDDDVEFEAAADLMLRSEVSAITQNGLEYGIALELRGQHDRHHYGFGGTTNLFNLGDCPAGTLGCASALVGGTPRRVQALTSQLYAGGEPDGRDYALALEGAHLFLRGAYGDITLGRDDGAAALFSVDTPSSLPMARSSNLRVDYTGLDMTKTVNDASGFAEKITYISPRLLGDNIGFGVQLGASFAPSNEVCGVDYCVKGHDLTDANGVVSPQMENVAELGLAIDRTFNNGLSAELVLNYAGASETSGLAEFDDLTSWGAGLGISYADLDFSASYLASNNGWAGDGDYTAFDTGLSWSPSAWGVTLGYGQSKDDLIGAEGSTALLGLSYDFDRFSLGGGVQHNDRTVPVFNGTSVEAVDQSATALFIEGGITF